MLFKYCATRWVHNLKGFTDWKRSYCQTKFVVKLILKLILDILSTLSRVSGVVWAWFQTSQRHSNLNFAYLFNVNWAYADKKISPLFQYGNNSNFCKDDYLLRPLGMVTRRQIQPNNRYWLRNVLSWFEMTCLALSFVLLVHCFPHKMVTILQVKLSNSLYSMKCCHLVQTCLILSIVPSWQNDFISWAISHNLSKLFIDRHMRHLASTNQRKYTKN